MIPQNTWSPSYTVVEEYPTFNKPLPLERPRVSAVSIGPDILNASNGSLTDRYWMVTQNINGQVVIVGAN